MSIASQHTPDWTYEVHELSTGFSAIVYDEHGSMVADHLTEERARLIAASHDLLEALVRIEKLATLFSAGKPLPEGESFDAWLEQARAAIAKAVSQ